VGSNSLDSLADSAQIYSWHQLKIIIERQNVFIAKKCHHHRFEALYFDPILGL
jgi:hypothetical protein